MPSELVGLVNNGKSGMWSRVKFPNGEQVMISMARDEAKLFKMKWGGLWPDKTLMALDAVALVTTFNLWGEYTPLQRSQEILARLTQLLMSAESAADAEGRFKSSGLALKRP